MKRYRYLDIARGIGLMLVIISHSCGLPLILINYYIPLFFVISGYIYKQGRSYGENVRGKALRLLVPYFGYSIVLLAFYAVTGRTAAETRFSAFGILYSRYCLYDTTQVKDNVYLFDVANGAMWYLTAFFVASLLYHLVIDRCLLSRKFMIVCIMLLLAATMALAELPVLLPWSIDIACVSVVFMIVGTLLGWAEFFEGKWNLPLVFGVFALYVFLSIVNPGINMSVREYGAYGVLSVPLFVLTGITGSMLCIWASKLLQGIFVGCALEMIGKNTIVLLAFHLLGLQLFEIIAMWFFDVGELSGVAFVFYHVVRITVAVCGSLVIGFIVEKGKLMIGRRWEQKRMKTE